MVDPTDIFAIDDIASTTDLQVEPVVVAADVLQQVFERYLRSDEELSDLSEQIGESAVASAITFTATLEEQDADAPVVRPAEPDHAAPTPTRCRYARLSTPPTQIPTHAPASIQGPKGMAVLRPARRPIMRMTP